jgi:hypothetical protein
LSSTIAFNRSRRSILGQAEERDPKEVGSEAQLSRRGNKQRKSADEPTASVEGKNVEGSWELHRRFGSREGVR